MQRAPLEAQQQPHSLGKKVEGTKIGQHEKAGEKNEVRKSEINQKIRNNKKEGEQTAKGLEQSKKTPLYYYDEASKQWLIQPYFQQYFLQQLQIIEQMNRTVNPKWSEQQVGEYFRFLKDLQTFITDFIFQFQIPTFQDFLIWLEAVKPYNPAGYELYERQLDFIQLITEGYVIKPYRGKEKDNKPPKFFQKKNDFKPTEQPQKYNQKPSFKAQQPVPKKEKKRYVQKSSLL